MEYQIKYRYIEWQKKPIDSMSYGNVSRGKAISYFIEHGLIPFIHSCGYNLTKSTMQLEDILASMMFTYNMDKNKIYRVSDTNLSEDMQTHYEYFCYIITYDKWDNFWKIWDNEFNGLFLYDHDSLAAQIQCVLWECIDLKSSSTYLKYLEEFSDSEHNDIPLKEDPYILDNLNRYENAKA